MNLYTYYIDEGDEGVIIASNLEEAQEIFKTHYPEREIGTAEDMFVAGNGKCIIYDYGNIKNTSKLICLREW